MSNFGKVVIAVLVTVIVVGGGGYYYMNGKAVKERNDLQARISDLDSKNNELMGINSATTSSAEATSAKCPAASISDPVVVYSPATFTTEEKSSIQTKVIDPYLYYMKNIENTDLVSVSIKKYAEADRTRTGYYFEVSYVTKTGGWGGWLLSQNGIIDYWKPDCMGECTLSDEFRTKFPNNIS